MDSPKIKELAKAMAEQRMENHRFQEKMSTETNPDRRREMVTEHVERKEQVRADRKGMGEALLNEARS